MRVLLTGGTGFIGRRLVAYLLQETNHELILLLPERYANPLLLPPELAEQRSRFTAVYADLRHFSLTRRAVREARAEAVIHLAAAGAADPFLGVETAVRQNLNGTVNLLRACCEKNHPPRQIIVARTPGERSAMNVYAASKAAGWAFCQMYARTQGWPAVGAMIFQAYGPGQPAHTLVAAATQAALAGQDFPMTAGTQQRDWVFVADVAAGLVAMLNSSLPPGETIELGTGQVTAVAEVVRQIYALAGGCGQPLIGVLPNRPGEETVQVANAARTWEMVGWKTAVSLPQGLTQTIAHYAKAISNWCATAQK